MLGQIAAPLTLVTLGMSLSHYKISQGWRESSAICLIKLLLMPGLIWALAYALHLPQRRARSWFYWVQWRWG
jgi:predicted permease